MIQYSHHVVGGGADFYAAVDRMGPEGMVSKRPDSVYRSGDTEAWLKIKCYEEIEYEVAGVQRKPGLAPLALMVTRDAERRYVGSANIALTKAMRERLYQRVQEGERHAAQRREDRGRVDQTWPCRAREDLEARGQATSRDA